MNFWILTPPTQPRYPILGGGDGGSKPLCILRPLCVDLDLGRHNFFLVYGPPNPWWGSQVQTPGTPKAPNLLFVSGSVEPDVCAYCMSSSKMEIFRIFLVF